MYLCSYGRHWMCLWAQLSISAVHAFKLNNEQFITKTIEVYAFTHWVFYWFSLSPYTRDIHMQQTIRCVYRLEHTNIEIVVQHLNHAIFMFDAQRSNRKDGQDESSGVHRREVWRKIDRCATHFGSISRIAILAAFTRHMKRRYIEKSMLQIITENE